MSTNNRGVSVVIPSFNNREKLYRLIDSLEKVTYRPLEVIVVDNSTTGEILKEGRKKFEWARWVDAGRENIGQTSVYNLGFAHANNKNHILYCDEDVVIHPKMISELVKRAESNKKIGIVTPMILYLSDHNLVNQAWAEVDLVTGKVNIGWGPKRDFLKAHEVQGSGTVMLFKREVVDNIGGFEDWFLCYFDPEYCVRAQKAGFVNWYEPKAICYHDQPKEDNLWRPRVLSRAYLLGRNRTLFMRKHGNILIYTFILPLFLVYYLVESMKFGILSKWIELVKGSIAGFFYPVNDQLFIPLPAVKKSNS